MPGTLLRDDWQSAVEDELKKHAQGVVQFGQNVQQRLQVVADQPRPDPQQVLSELQQHATNVAQQAQQSAVQFGQQAQQQVQQQLQDYANQVVQFNQPPLAPPAQPLTAPAPAAAPAPLGGGQYQDYARQAAVRAGIDPEQFVRQIQQESGFNPSAGSPAGAQGIAQIMPQYHPGVDTSDPYASLDYAARLMAAHKQRYGRDDLALVAYNGGQGAVDAWQSGQPYQESQKYVGNILNAPVSPREGITRAGAALGDVSQFGDPQLSNAEAYAACGPAAAVRFAERTGRNPTLREALDLAKQVGWTEAQGMAGISSQQNLMTKLGVPTKLVQGAQWNVFSREAQSGNPVTISTPGHYFYADGYDPSSGAFHVGRSGTDLRGGKEWMTSADMEGLMGGAQGGLLADSPLVPAPSSAVANIGGQRPAARAPLVVGGQQAASYEQPARTGLEVISDALSPVVRDLRQAAEEVTKPLAAAGEGLGGTVQEGLGGIGRGFEGANRAIRAGLGGEGETDVLPLGPSPGGGAVLGVRPAPFEPGSIAAQVQSGQRDVRNLSPEEGLQYTGQVVGAGLQALPPTYQALAGAKRKAIEENNPIREVFFAGGLSSTLADALTDPVTWALPWGRIANVVADLAVQAGARGVTGRITGEAVSNGIQNAVMEMAQPDSTPESIGQAFFTGAGFGTLIRGGLETPQARVIGEFLGAQTGKGWTALKDILRVRERGEANVDLALGGVPGMVERVRGGAEPVTPSGEPLPRTPPEPGPTARRDVAGAIEQAAVDQFGVTADPRRGNWILRDGQILDAGKDPSQPLTTGNDHAAIAEALNAAGVNPRGQPIDVATRSAGMVRYGLRRDELWVDLAGPLTPDQARVITEIAHGPAVARMVIDSPSGARTFGPGQEGQFTRAIQGAVREPLPQTPPTEVPPAISGRQGGQATLPFSLNVGGAVAGGAAGAAATPEGADWSEYARNVGLGATAGLVGTRGITRALERRPGLLAAAAGPEGGFRAPERPTLEQQLKQARDAGVLRAATAEPPRGPVGRPGREPRTLGEVHSNPHTLREAGPGDTSLGDEDLMAHADRLEERLAEVKARAEAVDEQLHNPNQKPDRPSWAAGYTNDQLVELARRQGVSAYEPGWYEKIGFEAGSGEVREDIGQSGIVRGAGQREPTPPELRAERNALAQEERDLIAAHDQLTTAPAGARFAQPRRGTDIPFDASTQEAAPHGPYAVENGGPSGNLAEDMVTRNGTAKRPSGLKTLWSEPGQVVARAGEVTGRGISDAGTADIRPPSEATLRAMPNLDALLKSEVPDEVRLQIQKAVEDNPDLFAAYQQGRISHESLRDDLARRVGMTREDWLKTPVGKGFSTPELVALQAAAVDAQHAATDMALEISARGIDNLSPEESAFALSNLIDTARLMTVASGARSTQGRSLNALKIRLDRVLSRGIAGANEKKAAERTAAQARRGAAKATQLLDKTRDLEQEAQQAVNKAREANVPRNVLQQIEDAYAQLDRYQAMSLHEKADEAARLAKERADRAATRKEAVRTAPEELLSALQAELKAEQKIFAGRKDTWETMAFWDSKANEIAAEKRRAFRGGLYLEAQRKSANDAAKLAERNAERAWESASRLQQQRTERSKAILEAIGGEAPSKDLLRAFTEAVASSDPMVAAKFLKGLNPKRTGFAGFVEMARNANIMRLAGMLSATATHIVNVGASVIAVPLELGGHALTVAIDIPRAAITGGERQAYAAELLPMVKAWGPGVWAQLGDAVRLLQTGVSPSQLTDLSTIRPGFRSSELPIVGLGLGKLPGRAAERVIDPTMEMPLRALQAEDLLMRGGAMAMHSQRVAIREATREGFRGAQRIGRANNIVANLEDYPELYREASESAARMVLQERRTVPGMANARVGGAAGEAGSVLVSQVLPFRKTPINVTAQGLGLSPLGLAGVAEAVGSRGSIAARVATGELPASRLGKQTLLAEERLARAAIGSMILGAGIWYGSMTDDQGKPKGTLTAMYDENEASTYPQGWRAWSVRQENPANGEINYIPLQNFGAAGAPLAMAAILTDAQRRGKTVVSDEKEMGRAVAAIGRYALDTPFLQGMSDVVDLLHNPGRAGTKFVEGLVGSYGPYSGMGRQIQRAQGVASRNPREGWLMMLDALEANYPGLSANVPEATTPLGEPRTQGATGFGALVGRYDIERDTPALAALRDAGVDVPAETKTVAVGRGYGVELTEAERDILKRARGAAITAAVEKEIAKPRVAEWQRTLHTAASDSAAYKDALQRYNGALQASVSGAAQAANIQFVRQLGRDEVQRRMKITRDVEPAFLGAPSTSPVPAYEEAVR